MAYPDVRILKPEDRQPSISLHAVDQNVVLVAGLVVTLALDQPKLTLHVLNSSQNSLHKCTRLIPPCQGREAKVWISVFCWGDSDVVRLAPCIKNCYWNLLNTHFNTVPVLFKRLCWFVWSFSWSTAWLGCNICNSRRCRFHCLGDLLRKDRVRGNVDSLMGWWSGRANKFPMWRCRCWFFCLMFEDSSPYKILKIGFRSAQCSQLHLPHGLMVVPWYLGTTNTVASRRSHKLTTRQPRLHNQKPLSKACPTCPCFV